MSPVSIRCLTAAALACAALIVPTAVLAQQTPPAAPTAAPAGCPTRRTAGLAAGP